MKVEKSFYSTLAKIAIPLALQNLISFGVGFADNIMVGSLGDIALSGVFVSNQVQWVLHMVCAGLSGAMVILAVQYIGKEDIHRAKIIIVITMKIAFALGALFTIASLLMPHRILGLFTEDPLVIEEGIIYFRVVCFSYVLFSINMMLLASMRSVQNTQIGFLSSLTSFCVNVLLNWILIFGNLGFPALGVLGAAIATLMARFCGLLVSLLYVRLGDKVLSLRLRDLKLWDRALLGDFFRYGTPVIMGDLWWGIAGAIQIAILGRLGTEILAANTIAANLHQVIGVFVYGLAGASGVIIGRTVGSGDVEKVKAYSRVLQKIFLMFGLISGLIIFFSKDFIIAMAFRGISAEASLYSVQFLTVFSVTIVGTAYQMSVLGGIVRAGGATHFVLVNDLIWVSLVVIPSALLSAFVFNFPPVVVFACLKSDQVLKCTVAVVKLHRWNWMKKLTR